MRKSILSINGNRSMNFLVQTVLSPRYVTHTAADVYQGMQELKKQDEIDLIIVDTDYHTQEACDFIQHVKTSGLFQTASVVVLTSDEDIQYNQSLIGHVDMFFNKPFSPEDIVKKIDVLTSNRTVNVL